METKKNGPAAAWSTRAQHGTWWLAAITAITMLAFATNSLLTRMALQTTPIDPATFAAIRLMTGACMLTVIIGVKRQRPGVTLHGLLPAMLLFVYAAAFSFAYRGMDTGAGALILFASAQLLMIGFGYARGEKTNLWGVVLALAGLVFFLSPSDAAPPFGNAALMMVAGMAWGGFSLVGRSDGSPVLSTANSFLLTVPLALALLWLWRHELHYDPTGALYAALSGGVTSALGYVVWYWVRVRMAAITAGTVQLSVPVLSAVLGVLVLDETLTARSAVAALVILLGIALTTRATRTAAQTATSLKASQRKPHA